MALNVQNNLLKNVSAAFTTSLNETVVEQDLVATCIAQGRNVLNVSTGGYFPTPAEQAATGIGPYECNNATFTNAVLNFNQSVVSECETMGTLTSSLKEDTINNISTALEQDAFQANDSVQDFLALAASSQVNNASNFAEIKNEIINSLRASTSVVCENNVQAFNEGNFVFCGIFEDSTINVSQDAAVSARVSCANDLMSEVFRTNTVLNELLQKIAQQNTSEQNGIGDFLLPLIIGIVVLILLIGGGYLIYKNSQKKPKPKDK